MKELSITAYDYMIGSVHDTYGLALTGKVNADIAKLSYRIEGARQSDASLDYTTSDVQADAYYYNLDLGANVSGILAGVNYEVLSGADTDATGAITDGKTAFSTPLATGHKFNGWADKFLATPTGGLKDFNVRLGYKAKGFGKILGVYHSFIADKDMNTATGTSDDLGTEFDAVYVNKIPMVKNLKGLLKYASYNSGKVTGYTNDVTKVWVGLDYKFATK